MTKRKQAKRKRASKKGAFLAAYSQLGNVTHAAELAKCNRQHVYRWIEKDPDFAKKFQEADEEAADVLEREARRRAVEGTERPVFHQGEQCGTIREYSDVLLIFLLKGRKPEKYRDNFKAEFSGGIGLKHSGSVDLRKVTDELESRFGGQLEELARSRFVSSIPGLLGAGGDGASTVAIPGSAARSIDGSNGHGPDPGENGCGDPGH